MNRDVPFQDGEIYHLYNRGTNKMNIFEHDCDYVRFKQLLFLCNQKEPICLADLTKNQKKLEVLFESKRGAPLVSVLGYCLMPNHFHLIVRQETEGGLARFMQKVATGYSMYFNKRMSRTGTLFQGKFKSKHIGESWYLNHIFSYVHLNPAELRFSKWKENVLSVKKDIFSFLAEYSHSSYVDYFVRKRPEREILTFDLAMPWHEQINIPQKMLSFYEDRLLDLS